MKYIFLTVIFFTIISSLSAQKLKKKVNINGNVKEVFYIDKKSKMQNGDYFKIHKNTKDTLVHGNFKNGMRTGTWIFKSHVTHEKVIKYDFSNDSLLFLAKEQFPDSFLVKVGNEFNYTKVDRPLIFLGHKDEDRHNIWSNLDIPKSIIQNGYSGTSTVCFIVNEKGTIVVSKILSSFNKSVEQQLNTIVNSYNGRFLPAIFNGHPVSSMFYVKINFGPTTNEFFKLPNNLPYIIDLDIHFKSYTVKRTATRMEIRHISASDLPANIRH
ncbi:MAG: hypothetical protein ABFS16_13545 [Bacteroidota bacterium]